MAKENDLNLIMINEVIYFFIIILKILNIIELFNCQTEYYINF